MLVVTALPVAMLQLTYSRSFRQYRERRQMEKLYGVTAAIRSTIDVNGVRAELIRAAQTLLDAGSVRLVPIETPARPGTLHVGIDLSRRSGPQRFTAFLTEESGDHRHYELEFLVCPRARFD